MKVITISVFSFRPFSKATRTTSIILILLLSAILKLAGADIIYVSPVNRNIVLLYFREGEKNTAESTGFNTAATMDFWKSGPLDTDLAKNVSTYTISSSDDSNYSTGTNPVSVGFKFKREAAYRTYWVYLQLPSDLIEGHNYTIQLGSLASNKNSETFIFNTKNLRSESIHVNQIGYAPNAGLKYAYVYQWMGAVGSTDFSQFEGNNFHIVRDSDSSVVYSAADHGKSLQLRKPLQLENTGISSIGWHGSSIWECDLSDLGNAVAIEPGEYRLAIDDIGCSYPFRIDNDVHSDLSRFLLRGLYHQRSGPARTAEYTDHLKPVNHTPGVNGFKVTYTTHTYIHDDGLNFVQLPAKATEWIWPDNPHPHMNDEADGWGWGGYFDAADCDRSRSHMSISTDLLLIYEMNPNKFSDNELNIPESGNGLPDIVDEAQWCIDLFRRLKGPTGGICGGLETTGYYHPSWEDNHMWYAYAEDAISSWIFAGTAAHLAYAYELAGLDQTEIDKWIEDAESAYLWAENTSPGNAGRSFIEQKYYAAACLYRITGNRDYLDDFLECRSWYSDLDIHSGSYVFCLTPSDRWENFTINDKTLQNSLISTIEEQAYSQGINQAKERALRFIKGSNPGINWGGYYPRVMLQMIYHHLSDNEEVLDLLYTTADLYFGINNDQQVSITGAELLKADRLLRDMLHIDSYYDGIPGWIPGIPPYKVTSTVFNASYFIEPSNPQDWPIMEQCLEIRDYIMASEFTVQETVTPMATLLSYLKAYSSGKQIIVNVDTPLADSVYLPGSDILISASASVTDGSVSNVEFFLGSVKVGEDGTAPFEFLLENMTAGLYDISVTAYSEGDSKRSKTVKLVVDAESPTVPGNLNVTKTEVVRLYISWEQSTDDAGVKEYQIYVNDELWTTSILPSCSVEGLSPETQYSLYVRAVDFAGNLSEASNIAEATTLSGNTIPGLIQAEDYDVVNGEVTPGDALDTDGTIYIGYFDEGESLEYAAYVETSDHYLVTFRVARALAADDFEFSSGSTLLKTLIVPNTGGWVQWVNIYAVVYLEEGHQNLIVKNTGSPFNINWMLFEPAVMPTGITIENCPTDSIMSGTSYDMTVLVSPENASDKSVIWSSVDENIATVDQTGKVTAVAAGNTDIIAKTAIGDFEVSCNIKVHPDNTSVKSSLPGTFNMYPNPFHGGTLTLQGEFKHVSGVCLTDLNGRIVHEKFTKNNNVEILMDIEHLQPGIYILRLMSNEERLIQKLIIL